MPYLAEEEPPRGVATAIAPGIRRLVAANPGPMTYWGTNTYLLDLPDGGVAVLDPGPDGAEHVARTVEQAGAPVRAILLSHAHRDHLGAMAALRAATGAPVHAWHAGPVAETRPDVPLRDGDAVAGLVAIHTPGHASDHLCFARDDGVLFSADHVMTWSTSIVNPPDGDMADYVSSLRRLLGRADGLLLPGHGPPSTAPQALVQELLDHRLAREAAILDLIRAEPRGIPEIVQALYASVHPRLHEAARRNVAAHLGKLARESRAMEVGGSWRPVPAGRPSGPGATPPASGGR